MEKRLLDNWYYCAKLSGKEKVLGTALWETWKLMKTREPNIVDDPKFKEIKNYFDREIEKYLKQENFFIDIDE